MNKEQLLSEIKQAISTGLISKEEIADNLSLERRTEATPIAKRLSLAQAFYYIGGLIVLIGLIVLVVQNWLDLSQPIRVLITLGMGIAFFISALLLSKVENLKSLGTVFYFLSAILMPVGYFVLFFDQITQTNFDFYSILVPFLCLLQFGIAQFVTKKDIFTIFNTIFGTWLFFSVTNKLINEKFTETFHLYRVFLVGISYLFVGYFLKLRGRLFGGLLNTLGIIGILGSGFILNYLASPGTSSWARPPEASAIWMILYPILVITTIIVSVTKYKNSSFLFVGTVALVAYIIRITGQYFTDTIGWPISLIFMGIIVIALGYLAFHLNKKYIKN